MKTLSDYYQVGLDGKKNNIDEKAYFESWKDKGTPVYENESQARQERPDLFSKRAWVTHSHANRFSRWFRLNNGEIIRKIGWDWDVPVPGAKFCYYLDSF